MTRSRPGIAITQQHTLEYVEPALPKVIGRSRFKVRAADLFVLALRYQPPKSSSPLLLGRRQSSSQPA